MSCLSSLMTAPVFIPNYIGMRHLGVLRNGSRGGCARRIGHAPRAGARFSIARWVV
jgi:hypothetical protein